MLRVVNGRCLFLKTERIWLIKYPAEDCYKRFLQAFYSPQIWLYAILGCIGEAFEETEEVCGIVVRFICKVQL